MTELLYQTDAYLKEFDAVVSGHDEEKHGVLLDRTAFYPGGGGQPADFGELRVGDTVYPLAKVERGNVHVIEADIEFARRRHGGARRSRLGAPLPTDADAHGDAYPLRRRLARLRCAGHGR